MLVVAWNDSLKTKHTSIDRDNRLILEKAQNLGRSIAFGTETYQVVEALVELKKVIREHFEQIEMMQQYDHFSNYYTHKNSHTQFLNQLGTLSHRIMNNPFSQAHIPELNALMSAYCEDQIQRNDNELAKFFMNRDFYNH